MRVIKAYGRVKEQLHILLTSALNGDEWSSSMPRQF